MAKAKAKKALTVSKADGVAIFKALGFAAKAVDGWSDDMLLKKLNKLPQLIDDGKKLKDKKLDKLLQEIVAHVEDGGAVELAAGKAGKKDKAAAPAKGKAKGKGKKAAADEDDEDDDSDDDEEEDADDEDDDDSDSDDEEDGDDDEDGDDSDDDEEDDEEESEDEDDSDDDGDEDADDEDEDESDEEDEDDSEDDEDDEEDDVPATKKKSKDKGKGKGGKDDGAAKKPGVIQAIINCLEGATEDKPVSKKSILKVLVKKFKDREESAMQTTINVQLPNRLKTEKGLNIQKNEKGYWIAKGKAKVKAKKK